MLVDAGHLTADLGARLQRWMGFRNELVHFYLDLDHGRTYDAIHDGLEDLADFARAMAKLLDD